MALRASRKNTEDEYCELCGELQGKFKKVKYGNGRKRLLTCEQCWQKYYRREAACEKISFQERLAVIAEREKDLAVSRRKWRNLLYSFSAIVVIWLFGRLMLNRIFTDSVFGTGAVSESLMGKMNSGLNVIGAILAGYCFLLIVFRLVMLLIQKE